MGGLFLLNWQTNWSGVHSMNLPKSSVHLRHTCQPEQQKKAALIDHHHHHHPLYRAKGRSRERQTFTFITFYLFSGM